MTVRIFAATVMAAPNMVGTGEIRHATGSPSRYTTNRSAINITQMQVSYTRQLRDRHSGCGSDSKT